VHVLDQPPDSWTGESGRIDAAIVARHVPDRQLARYQYFACGAPAMLDAIEQLLLSMGVPPARINTERFDFV
jgi:NAD(P)H-flavin reductase